jgi:hypothetical protein
MISGLNVMLFAMADASCESIVYGKNVRHMIVREFSVDGVTVKLPGMFSISDPGVTVGGDVVGSPVGESEAIPGEVVGVWVGDSVVDCMEGHPTPTQSQ